MTIEPASPAGQYTVMGTGPYAINWPYADGAVRAAVVLAGIRTELVPSTDFTVFPLASSVSGDLTLSAGAAATYVGGTIYLSRDTIAEQGWVGTLGEREKGLETQLDVLTMKAQEQEQGRDSTLRFDTPVSPMVRVPDRVIMFDDLGQPVAGPTASEVSLAQQAATDAIAAKILAQAAAASSLGAGNNNTWTGVNIFNNLVRLLDGRALKFGTDDDAFEYFDNALQTLFRGGLPGIKSIEQFDTAEFRNVAGALLFKAVSAGAFEAYFNGIKKFETLAGGAKITGDLSADTASGAWLASQVEAVAGALATKLITPQRLAQFFDARITFTPGTDGVFSVTVGGVTFKLEWKRWAVGAAASATVTVPWPSAFATACLGQLVACDGPATNMIGTGTADRFNATIMKGGGDTAAHQGTVWGWGY